MAQVERSDIAPRSMNFRFDEGISRYWFGNDQFKTLLFTTLSSIFPDGERFFIQSVRHFQQGIVDDELRRQVRGFIGQEAHHRKEHHDFNMFMESRGLRVSIVEDATRKGVALMERWLSPQRQLAKTCAMEHFTAMLCEQVLSHPEMLAGIDPRMESLWLWHAIEESEHKAVAFDVYRDQVGRYGLRVSEMLISTMEFSLVLALHYVRLQRASGLKTDWRSVRQGLHWLFGRDEGWIRRLGRSYLAYYSRDFHPSQHDASAQRREALVRLAELTGRSELQPV